MLKWIIKHLEGSVERGTANTDLSNRSYFLVWQGDRSCWQKQMHVWSRCLAQSALRQTQQVCGRDRSTAWWAQNGLESVTRRVLMISSLSKWKFWSRRARQEAAWALWLLAVFGSESNDDDDGLKNDPRCGYRQQQEVRILCGAGGGLQIARCLWDMAWKEERKRKKNTFNREKSKQQIPEKD